MLRPCKGLLTSSHLLMGYWEESQTLAMCRSLPPMPPCCFVMVRPWHIFLYSKNS